MNKTDQKIGLFVGTFDPPHAGHRNLVRQAIETFGLTRVHVYADSIPRYKFTRQPHHHRQEMLRRLFQDDVAVHIGAPDHAPAINGEGHLWEIYAQMTAAFPAAAVHIIMGVDTFVWYRDVALQHRPLPPADLIVVRRDQTTENILDRLNGGHVQSFVQNDQELSSTIMRQKLSDGIRPDEIPAAVFDYIQEKGFYRAGIGAVSTMGDSRHWIAREKAANGQIGNVGIEVVANPHLYGALLTDLDRCAQAMPGISLRWIDFGAGTGKLSRDILLADAADVPGLWGLDAGLLQRVRQTPQQNVSYEKDSPMVDVGHAALQQSSDPVARQMAAEKCDLGVEHLPEKDTAVDMAVSRTLLMHLDEPGLHHHLAEVRRVLKPGACYHALVLNPGYQIQNLRWFGNDRAPSAHEKIIFQHGDAGAIQGFTHYYRNVSTYYDMFRAAGFEMQDFVHPAPRPGWEETHARYYRAETPLFAYMRLLRV